MLLSALLLGSLVGWGSPDPKCPDECILTAQPVSGSISVDGFLDEDTWARASVAAGFSQFSPDEGAPATQQTEVRVVYGSDALYIGVTLLDEDPNQIRRPLGRRDEFNQADWFIASIDSYFDRKTAYNFAISASGVQADGIYAGRTFGGGGGGGFGFDTSWDAVWFAEVRVTDEGWTAEIRIPYSMLRFSDSKIQRWGINFKRIIPRLSEIDEWVLVPRNERSSGTVAHFGVLEGIVDIQARRNIQVTPYTVASVRFEEGEIAGSTRRSDTGDFGSDLKIGLSSNITLDATINPDFGQVEADPAELNLTAFETFFPERRPFFTEGTQIFRYSLDRGGSLLYTRRIGARAPIVGATKVSGRTGRGMNFGFFGAATGDDFNPSNFFGVGRGQQQIGSLSNVGGMVTYFGSTSERRSTAGGVDWDLRFKQNKYKIDGQFSATRRVVGDETDSGFALTAGFDKQRSVWNYSIGLTVISDAYNPNDLGRMRENNKTNLFGGFSHQINGGRPVGPFQRGSLRLYAGSGLSYKEGISNGTGFFFSSDWTTRTFQEIELGMRSDYLFGGYDVTETRGLGPRARPRELNMDVEYTTDTRRTWQLAPQLDVGLYGDGGRSVEASLEGEWTASSRINLSLEVGVGREIGVTEWTSNEAFAPGPDGWLISESSRTAPEDVTVWHPFADSESIAALLAGHPPNDLEGRYYLPVFGERNTHSTDITLRGNLTLTPTLAVQFYGQLFVARGKNARYLLLTDRDTLVPVTDYPKRYDFGFNNLQANTVLRWEYRPGSTLYVVWTQSRSSSDDLSALDLVSRSPYDQRTSDQLMDAFSLFPTNILLVKFSYKFLR